MIALLQRVSSASVAVGGETVAAIDRGLLVLLGVERGDTDAGAVRIAGRLAAYRVFPDETQRMNLDVRDVGGAVLLVPQFTLAANTDKGNRPSFTGAATPEEGRRLFRVVVDTMTRVVERVETGRFGADMQVALVGDGPVTFWLRVPPRT